MFHYFLKVVSTQFHTLDGKTVNSHQYSVTHFERDLETGAAGNTVEGIQIMHGVNGLPGEWQFSFPPSPLVAVTDLNIPIPARATCIRRRVL
jgi:hypothetical protein